MPAFPSGSEVQTTIRIIPSGDSASRRPYHGSLTEMFNTINKATSSLQTLEVHFQEE